MTMNNPIDKLGNPSRDRYKGRKKNKKGVTGPTAEFEENRHILEWAMHLAPNVYKSFYANTK